MTDINSRGTRVIPVFDGLTRHGGLSWRRQLIELAGGLGVAIDAGSPVECRYREEMKVAASPERLAWLIRNAVSSRLSGPLMS